MGCANSKPTENTNTKTKRGNSVHYASPTSEEKQRIADMYENKARNSVKYKVEEHHKKNQRISKHEERKQEKHDQMVKDLIN